MKARLLDLSGRPVGELSLPQAFRTPWRPDLIAKAVRVAQANRRQAYGVNTLAGKRTSAHYHGLRGARWTMMNRELARLPRLHATSPHLQWRARFAPQTVGGREAHPPKARSWKLKLNRKERRLSLASAVAATIRSDLVASRGHEIEGLSLPLVVRGVESLKRASEVKGLLLGLGLEAELRRIGEKTKRGTFRVGPLLVITADKGIWRAARNLPGLGVLPVELLNVESLSPGARGARLVIWSEPAFKSLGDA